MLLSCTFSCIAKCHKPGQQVHSSKARFAARSEPGQRCLCASQQIAADTGRILLHGPRRQQVAPVLRVAVANAPNSTPARRRRVCTYSCKASDDTRSVLAYIFRHPERAHKRLWSWRVSAPSPPPFSAFHHLSVTGDSGSSPLLVVKWFFHVVTAADGPA